MILLWTLSPLGGQLALRLLSKSPSIETYNSTIRYLPMAASLESKMDGASGIDSAWPSYRPIFMASLVTSRDQKDSSQDLYGNVKIPSLDRLGSGHAPDVDSWTVLNYNETIPYSSRLRIPVVKVPRTGWLSFDLVSKYMAVDCDAAILQTNSSVFLKIARQNLARVSPIWKKVPISPSRAQVTRTRHYSTSAQPTTPTCETSVLRVARSRLVTCSHPCIAEINRAELLP